MEEKEMQRAAQQKRRKKKSTRKKIIVYDCIILVLVVAIGVIAARLMNYYHKTENSKSKIAEIKELIETYPAEQSDKKSKKKNGDTSMATRDFSTLKFMNEDFVGWITIDDTIVDYPVMQSQQDNAYYLHRDFDKNYDFAGLIFADNRCQVETDDILLLYGHHMNNGTMFAELLQYQYQAYKEAHPYIQLETMKSKRVYEVFAAFTGNVYDVKDTSHYHYYDFIGTPDKRTFRENMEIIKNGSLYQEDFPKYGTKILMLSTCKGNDTQRFVVLAKEVAEK